MASADKGLRSHNSDKDKGLGLRVLRMIVLRRLLSIPCACHHTKSQGLMEIWTGQNTGHLGLDVAVVYGLFFFQGCEEVLRRTFHALGTP